MSDLPRPFTDHEYSLLVLNALKRSVRISEALMHWVPPRHWASGEADRREIMDAIDVAIECVRQHVRGNR